MLDYLVGSKSNDKSLHKRERRSHVKTEQRWEGCGHKPRDA